MKNSILLSILFIIFFSNINSAQEIKTIVSDKTVEKVNIPKKHIEQYKKDSSFDYTVIVKEQNIIERFFNWIKRKVSFVLQKILEWIFGAKKAGKYLEIFFKALPYIAIVVFLFFIFKYLLGIDLLQLKRKKIARFPTVDLTDEARIMQEENLDKLINKAVANHNYRLAVRYYYLATLKKMVDLELIDWRPEKTNRDYVTEVKSKTFISDFKKLTFIYDYVWYGNFIPTKDEFSDIAINFSNFKI